MRTFVTISVMNKDALPNNINQLKSLFVKTIDQHQTAIHQSQLEIKKLYQEKTHWQDKYESLLESFRLSKLRQFTASSEKHILQDDLFDEADAPIPDQADDAEQTLTVASYQRQKKQPKRTVIPAHFPREPHIHDINEADKICDCGCQKIKIGEEISEQLDIIKPSFKVIQHIRPKYACKRCQLGVSIAPMPKVLLPKSIAAPGLVAYTITAKYTDSIPLYRQEQIWQRYGVTLPRNTLCGWLMKTAEQCEPLWDLVAEHILLGNYIQADESPVQVLNEPTRSNQQNSYMWIYRGGLPNKIGVYFTYQETRAGQHAKDFLKNFKGYVQTDGYSAYDWIDAHSDMVHLACMAHARRPFAELAKLAKKAGKAHEAIKLIGELYHIEKEIRLKSVTERYAIRQERSKPILDKIKLWLDKSIRGSPPKGKLGKAIQYMLDRWQQLNYYLLDGQLHIDNNPIENDIRLFALGKKNWLFKGSPRGAKAGAIFYSLIKTAQANGLEPYQYLCYLFNQLLHCKEKADYEKLLPWNLNAEIIQKI